MKIVVVDDNKQFVELEKEYIELHSKVDCVAFSNPCEAQEHILTEGADILITDYEMPQMNGFTLAKQLVIRDVKTKIYIASGNSKDYLVPTCNQYDLEGKVEIIPKGDLDILGKIINTK